MTDKNIKSSGTGIFSIPFAIACLFSGLNTSSNFKIDHPQPQAAIYVESNKNSNVVNNYSITLDMNNSNLLTQRNIKNLINCINEEPANLGTEVYYFDYFKSLRDYETYEYMFYSIINNYSLKYTYSYLNLLSQISYEHIFNFEKIFVINCLSSDILKLQEYALNTISIWNDKALINSIANIKMKNPLLQKRLNKIVAFYGE